MFERVPARVEGGNLDARASTLGAQGHSTLRVPSGTTEFPRSQPRAGSPEKMERAATGEHPVVRANALPSPTLIDADIIELDTTRAPHAPLRRYFCAQT